MDKTHYEVMHRLQKAGVRAGAVLNAEELLVDPHLNDRGFFKIIDKPETGEKPYAGLPFLSRENPGHPMAPSPCLGEHNKYVLGSLLGYSDEEINGLEKDNIIGTRPLPDGGS